MNQGCNCSRLKGKVAIVTASTAGIGYSISLRLASEGAKVVICSRKQENVDSVVSDLRCKGFDVIGTACHVGSLDDIKALVKFTLSGFRTNTIDILVSNAAVNPAAGPILETDDAVIDKIMDINGVCDLPFDFLLRMKKITVILLNFCSEISNTDYSRSRTLHA